VFSKLPIHRRIVFLFTTGEEQGMLGAWVYSRELAKGERDSIRAVYALDMFADLNQSTPLIYTCDGEPDTAVALLLAACEAYPLPKPLLSKEFRSDHAPFYGIGLPAALFAQSESDELYHTPYDTMDKLSAEYMDLVFAWTAGILLR
jgi:Zn-dependent M28 family amino/carboxypeptidase